MLNFGGVTFLFLFLKILGLVAGTLIRSSLDVKKAMLGVESLAARNLVQRSSALYWVPAD